MKKLLTIIFCLGALTLFSCEDSSDDIFQEIDTEISKGDDFDNVSAEAGDFDSVGK